MRSVEQVEKELSDSIVKFLDANVELPQWRERNIKCVEMLHAIAYYIQTDDDKGRQHLSATIWRLIDRND